MNIAQIVLTALLAGIVGAAIRYIVSFVGFIYSQLFRTDVLAGTWHAYHFTRQSGSLLLRCTTWDVKRDWRNRLIVRINDRDKPNLKYEGIISLERNYFLIRAHGVGHQEEVQMRFFYFIPTGRDMVFGLLMGVDFDNKAQCVVRVICRQPLSDEEARRQLTSKTMLGQPGILSIAN